MYAAVFVRDPAARVNLSADVYPDAPWSDKLTVTVSGKSRNLPGWLLVVECPANTPRQSGAVQLTSETVPQMQSPNSPVAVYSGTTTPRPNTMFRCFPAPGSRPGPGGAPTNPPSLANVSLPALQIDQGMVAAQAAPLLYAQQGHPGSTVSQLYQMFPGTVCPSATPSPSASSPGTASVSSPATATPQSSGSATAPRSPSPSFSPSPSAPPLLSPTTAPANPSCLNLAPAGTHFTKYVLPSSVTTTETLHRVDTQGYQISMFPVGITEDEKDNTPGQPAQESIVWSARSGLNPSLDATNNAAESAANHDIFVAGVFFGLASGAMVEFVNQMWAAFSEKKKRRSGIIL